MFDNRFFFVLRLLSFSKGVEIGLSNNEFMIIGQHTQENSLMNDKSEGILIGHGILDALISSGMVKTSLVKTASANPSEAIVAAIKAFATALESLATVSNVPQEAVAELSKTASSEEVVSKDVTIKVASTTVKDSHYFMDVSLDPIKKSDKSLVMVSFLMREGYLGRYMIKRCFYYLPSNVKEAHETYNEIVRKAEGVKHRYLQGEAKPFDIMPQVKSFLDGIRGDFEFKDEDSLGTTVKRDREGYHAAEGPPYVRMA